jgi:DNA polymerase-3 subunit alpha
MSTKPFWSLHTHSKYSANDAMPSISDMVDRAVDLRYPALSLTDHGTPSGGVQLYKACRKAGIEPLIGEEFYITPDREQKLQANYHITITSMSETGYRNLVHLHNLAQSNFFYKPRIDLADIASLAEQGRLQGLVASTGCYFGLVMQTLEKRGPRATRRLLEALAGWFPRLYVELHDHEVKHDDGTMDADFVDELVSIADAAGLPYIIAQDSHYLTPEQQPLHNALKALVSWSDDPSEAQFPGGPYSMVDRDFLANLYTPTVLDRAIDNLTDLAERSHLRLPELEHFQMRVPDVTITGDANGELEARVAKHLEERGGTDADWQRQADELLVVLPSGYAGYLLLVADVCDMMRAAKIWYQVRGSASGSQIVYDLGITQLDPIVQGLRMDRFMSNDRMKPPDIDIDVEHERRDEVIAYLSSRFTVRQIGSHMKYSITADPDDEDETKGSLMVRYFTSSRKRNSTITEWGQIPRKDQAMLRALGDMKLISQPGTHAAGYIVSPDERAAQQLPLTWMAKQKRYVTAYAMKDVETLGFVKLDLLGLRTMTAIRITCEALGWSQTDFEAIPMNDKQVFAAISKGKTDGVFQLDGKAMKYGCMDLKPKTIGDIIAAQALFRPAAREAKATDQYIARRRGQQEVPVRHTDIQAETHDTYGVLLYQEQVIGVLRRMGMGPDELTAMLSAVKASNEHSAGAAVALEQAKPRIRELAQARGWGEDDIDWLLSALVAYGEYSFNKAHAAAYGITAYRCAWLSVHHPVEFWLGMTTAYANHWREKLWVRCARQAGVLVLGAHVNDSGVTWKMITRNTMRNPHGKALRRGLVSVPGIGVETSKELAKHQPYESLNDLAMKVIPRKVTGSRNLALGLAPADCSGAIAALAEYGALNGLEWLES